MTVTFDKVFRTAMGPMERTPYGYQCRLACGPNADPRNTETLISDAVCEKLWNGF